MVPCLSSSESLSSHLAKHIDQHQAQDAADATINCELAALKRMSSLGHKANLKTVLHMPPFPQLKENNIRQGFLEDSQYEMLIQGGRRNQQCKTLLKKIQ